MSQYGSTNSLRPVRSLGWLRGQQSTSARTDLRGSAGAQPCDPSDRFAPRPQGATLHSARAIGRSTVRPAFSLAELVVAIGVLLLMFALAGEVFSLTVRSTGQALALTNVTQTLRALEDTLREDLRQVQPGRTLLWIQGNPVNAYWTREGRELDDDATTAGAGPATGYPHPSDPSREFGPEDGDKAGNLVPPRADLLMFFTARPGVSAVDPSIRANQQLVLYGHATSVNYKRSTDPGIVSYKADPNTVITPSTLTPFPMAAARGGMDYASATKVSPVAAEDWTLARRGVLLVPTPVPTSDLATMTDVADVPTLLKGLTSEQLLFGLTDVIGNFDFERQVLTPFQGWPFYEPMVLWNSTGGLPDMMIPDIALRSVLDDMPPAPLAATFAQQLLSRCASFKVEWALDPRSDFVAGRLDGLKRMIWIDPGEPVDPAKPCSGPLRALCDARENAADGSRLRRNLDSLLREESSFPNRDVYSLGFRFGGRGALGGPDTPFVAPDDRANVAAFGVRGMDRNGDGTLDSAEVFPDPIFPVALRITVDVFDSERRLGRPIRHVMVIPIGG